MIHKLVNRRKMSYLKKFPRPFAVLFFKFIIILDEILWTLRIKLSIKILGKKSEIGNVLKKLNTDGYAIFEKYYSDENIEKIKSECVKLLDKLPAEKIKSEEKIENLVLSNGLVVEKLKESIKIKGLNNFNLFFKTISKNPKINKISNIYQLTSSPVLIYNLVHDGKYSHPAVSSNTGKVMIAGQPHIDMSTHTLRCALALENIEEHNGPTIVFKRSMKMKKLKKNYTNIFLETFGFNTKNESGHNLDSNDIKYLEKNSERTKVVCKKGDLVLIDLKTAHYQSTLNRGQRHILWHYC